jgi:hypothetical protein
MRYHSTLSFSLVIITNIQLLVIIHRKHKHRPPMLYALPPFLLPFCFFRSLTRQPKIGVVSTSREYSS